MIELTPKVIDLIESLFPGKEHEVAKRLLETKCAETVPMTHSAATARDLESIRCDALVVSGGDIGELPRAIRLANTDWRDLCVAADSIRNRQGGRSR